MVDLGALASMGDGAVDAATLIGIVLVEAAILYVGYGAVEEAFGHVVVKQIRGK
ncbi:hypothetical protein ACFQGE_06145 [Halomicroarcula sp. GCM10025817]|uniref:DUF7512 family protein n=1 Tax=Haloarcula TaxID=2237 RepID=UPI0023E8C851|nr:hypothetical protein [Halomicroarcula sp. SYNS111]